LIGGIAAYFSDRIANRTIKVIGVEPKQPHLDVRAASRCQWTVSRRRRGRLAGAETGGRTDVSHRSAILRDRVVLVSDHAICEAQSILWDQLRIAAEPGGAAAFSALLSGAYLPDASERVGVIVCGGNTTAVAFHSSQPPVS
jgi:threonine dehydratase